ncbi:MAG: SUMF1/EgtB/PvdO family nonheme iron enzyme [Planctomycetes bacterium]|nr:SUMF1/EgtB/PvdO family nonheme iron enzyme [Planctomycetota bacterium]
MSSPIDDDRLADLFHRAVHLDDAARERFVVREVGADPALREELRALLAADSVATQAHLRSPLAAAAGDGDELFGVGADDCAPYRLIAEIGEGGMGRVYRAEQAAPLRRTVAVKVLRQFADSEVGRARFRNEQQVLARLDHRGIARVLDGGCTAAGRPFLVTELVPGVPLQRWVAANEPPLSVRLALFAQLCDAVQYAHQKGVIHRDLKPSNVLVVDVDGGPEVRVIDFGIARVVAPDLGEETLHTAAAVGMGTPGYMSPEQAADAANADARSDVYALGVVLYELLTGALPRGRATGVGVLDFHREPPRPSSRRAPGVAESPVDLDWVVLRALAAEPDRRYATVSEFAADVVRAARHEPVAARPPTWAYLVSRWLRRHRVAAAMSAASAVFVVVAAWLVVGSWREAEQNWADYRRLVDDKRLADLVHEARDELWPPWPERLAAIDAWLQRAAALSARRGDLVARAATLSARADAARTPAEREELAWQCEVLDRLCDGLDALVADAPRDDNLAGVRARRAEAERVGAVSLTAVADTWRVTLATIADRDASPAYDGLVLPGPQVGLVPLGRDARSGLQLFWHVESGQRPEVRRDDAGAIEQVDVTEASGAVFVLVPGGRFTIGALPRGDARSGTAAIDPDAAAMERFVRDMTLAPFFVGVHELTQGQWLRLTGERPSQFTPEREARGHRPDDRWPVEQVNWFEADRALRRRGLALPTEAQWEYFARAGTRTVFGGVPPDAPLDRHMNLADEGSKGFLRLALESGLDDGFAVAGPVGSFLPNPWGLYDCHGNVAEWCRDWLVSYLRPAAAGDGFRAATDEDRPTLRCTRGGDFGERRLLSRVASRNGWPPEQRSARIGVRAVRVIR